MALPTLNLMEPIVNAMVTLLNNNLAANVTAFNNSLPQGDLYPLPAFSQIVPYTPVPSTLEVGGPVIGVWELGATFEDDLQYSLHSEYMYAVVAVLQNSDHITLMWELRRYAQVLAYTIQQDRLAGSPPGSASVMRTQGGAWSVNFVRSEPGPLLGDMDPVNPDAPPRSYLSWTGLVFSSRRTEI